jgi:two-component system chemotaxis response regulator CheB
MPKDFTKVFSSRLNDICELSVREAKSGDVVTPGEVLVAPSGYQTMLKLENGRYVVEVLEIRSLYKPSVDFLFQSLTTVTGGRTVAVLLTGMGGDGARGLKALRDLGARTITEAEETCVVYGMPKVAWEMGAGEFSLPLPKIPEAILTLLRGPEKMTW